MTPPPEFGPVLRELGGRVNRHWLTERGVVRRWGTDETEWERAFLDRLEGWPVARLSEPVERDGALWSLMPHLPGAPRERSPEEGRARGRLLAEFHLATRNLDLPPRPGWRTTAEILADPAVERACAPRFARDLEAARRAWEGIGTRPRVPVHGDFATWNLLFEGDRLTGLLDFELARTDDPVSDFGLSWRGAYPEVIAGYEEVSPLSEEDRAAIAPVWRATLLEAWSASPEGDDGWTERMLGRLDAASG